MKYLLLLLVSFEVFAGTCSSISRTNFSANSVLTSSALNSQFNTVYSAANALDGGCVSDGTLEIAATDSSWDELKNYLQAGCKVSYSNASTLSISKCYLAVNGEFVGKSTATSVAFGCTNCSSETASTTYYVYVADGSTGTTLTPLILTTAPNDDGYDASSNRVIGRFYNNATGDISQYSIDQWNDNRFVPSNTDWNTYTPSNTQGFGTITGVNLEYRREGKMLQVRGYFTTGTVAASEAQLSLPESMVIDSVGTDTIKAGTAERDVNRTTAETLTVLATDGDNFVNFGGQFQGATGNTLTEQNGNSYFQSTERTSVEFEVPVEDFTSL